MSKKFNFSRDLNNVPIAAANGFVVEDETGTPKTSPQTITNGSSLTLTIPERAAVVYLLPIGGDLKLGADEDCTEYDLLMENIKEEIGIVSTEYLYFKNNSGSSITLYFRFSTI